MYSNDELFKESGKVPTDTLPHRAAAKFPLFALKYQLRPRACRKTVYNAKNHLL